MMTNSILILLVETVLSTSISLALLYLLQPVLQALLQDVCHGKTRALFWSTFTRLMLLIAPLLVVLLYSHSLSSVAVDPARIVRDTMLHILFGQFVALLVVGAVLLRFSYRDQRRQTVELPVWQPHEED